MSVFGTLRKSPALAKNRLPNRPLELHLTGRASERAKQGLKGLCDEVHEAPFMFELGGRNVLVTHHLDRVRESLKQKADIGIFGHTHEPEINGGKPLLINPGECGGWLYGRPSVAVLDLETLEAHVIFLE